MRNIVMTVLIVMLCAVFVGGCGCFKERAAGDTEPVMVRVPCDAPPMVKSVRSYPTAAESIVTLEKMAPEEVIVNQPFTYRMKVTNTSDTLLTDVIVTEVMPANMAIESSEPEVARTTEIGAHWNIGQLGPGESKMVTVTAIAEGSGSIRTCGLVRYDSPVCATMALLEPKLEIVKVVPGEALSCDRIPVKYMVRNTGSGDACDIKVTDKLPEGILTAEGSDELVFSLDSLESGESHTFEAMVDATRLGTFSSAAVVTSSTSGRATSNLVATRVIEPALEIVQIVPEKQYIGREITYEITLRNTGDGPANDTELMTGIPEGVKFSSATEGGLYTHHSPGKVTWKLGVLEPGEEKTVYMTVSSESAGVLQTTTVANAHCAEEAEAIGQTSLAGIPAILVEVIDTDDPIQVGDSETYIVTVTNQGSAPATNIEVKCMLEEHIDYVSSEGPTNADVRGENVHFVTLPSLAPKEKAVWRVRVKGTDTANSRFKVEVTADQFRRPIEETEATVFFR